MEELLRVLYFRSLELNVDHVERGALHGLSLGYHSTYRLSLLYPWMLKDVTDLVPVHGRLKAIGWRLEILSRDADIPVSERVEHAADLLGSYVMGTDSELVSRGLEIAWELLHAGGRDGRLSLPCRTSGMCRLLSQCHYFTGDKECLDLARGLVVEALGRSGAWGGEELLDWLGALRLYADVSDGVGAAALERERLEEESRRLSVRGRRVEDGLVEEMRRGRNASDSVAFSRVFSVVARRVLEDSVETEGRKI